MGSLLLTTSVGTLVAGQAIINRYTENVVVEDLLGEAAVVDNSAQTTPTGELVEGPLNILLVGSDYRADPELAGLPWRADTIMVVHVPRTHDRAYIISIQRDLWVEIPPYRRSCSVRPIRRNSPTR